MGQINVSLGLSCNFDPLDFLIKPADGSRQQTLIGDLDWLQLKMPFGKLRNPMALMILRAKDLHD